MHLTYRKIITIIYDLIWSITRANNRI